MSLRCLTCVVILLATALAQTPPVPDAVLVAGSSPAVSHATEVVLAPQSIALAPDGTLYIATLQQVWHVDAAGLLSTIPALAQTSPPTGELATDTAGDLFIAQGNRILEVTPQGGLIVIGHQGPPLPDGSGPVPANSVVVGAIALTVDSQGNIFYTDGIRVWKISPDGILRPFAGTGKPGVPAPVAGPVPSLQYGLIAPWRLAADRFGNVYIDDPSGILRVTPDGTLTQIGANPGVNSLAVDGASNLYASLVNRDNYAGQVARIAPDGSLHVVAGSGAPGFSDGCTVSAPGVPQAINATLSEAYGLAVDTAGNIYFAADGRVREITLDGQIHTVAGGPGGGFGGDGGPATSALLSSPGVLTFDPAGNLYVADRSNNRVRCIDSSGVIQTVAGRGVTAGQDPTCFVSAGIQLSQPSGLASDPSGNIYISDTGNGRVLKLATDGSLAEIAANLNAPSALAFSFNNLYIAEHDRVSYITPDGNIGTFYGSLSGTMGLVVANSGDVFLSSASSGSLDLSASGHIFSVPIGVPLAAGPAGEIYSGIKGVSRFDPDCTVSSTTFPYSFAVQSIAVGPAGDLYVSDGTGNRIWQIPPLPHGSTVPLSLGLVVNGATLRGGFITVKTPFFPGGYIEVTEEVNETPAPGEIVAVNGMCLGPLQFSQGLSSNLNSVQISFSGVAAPILSASPNQLLVQVPYETPLTGTASLTVQYQSQHATAALTPEIASVHIFPVANATYVRGDTVSLLITGAGQTVPASITGQIAGDPGPQPAMPVHVTVGGEAAQVLFAAADAGSIGTTRVTFRIPSDLNPGKTTILVAVGPSSDTITAQLK